jgi:hypothetical protein
LGGVKEKLGCHAATRMTVFTRMEPDIVSGYAIDCLERSGLAKPVPFKPFTLGSQRFAAMIERTQQRTTSGSQVCRPLTICGWLNVTSSTNAQLPDTRQVDRFTVNTTNAAISLNYDFHDVLQLARTTQDVAARPINQ